MHPRVKGKIQELVLVGVVGWGWWGGDGLLEKFLITSFLGSFGVQHSHRSDEDTATHEEGTTTKGTW